VWALAFREGRPPISPAAYAVYREKVDRYARMPLPWLRRWRYRLGSLIFGRRPFAPWLDRENWRGRCLNAAVRAADLGVQRSELQFAPCSHE
jgi:hypothetical protein